MRALLATACLLLAACTTPVVPPVSPSPTATTPARSLAGEPMRDCFVGVARARCGSVLVAADPGRPEARRIQLNVAVVPATGPAPRPQALFLLSGGPGGASTTSFTWAVDAFAAVRTTHDLVLVDQRGTGGSDPLRVPAAPDVHGLPAGERAAAIAAWAVPAFAALPADVRFYATRVAADDLDAVRAALGYERIDLYGASYGATLAQYYLRQHPTRVRSVVLDGATLVEVPVLERIPIATQRALDLLLARCDADASCHAAYPRLSAELASLLDRVARDPVTLAVDGQPVVVDREALAGAVHSLLLGDATMARLPALVHAAYEGRWDEIAATASVATTLDDLNTLAMSLVIRCSEAWARWDPNEVARLAPDAFETSAQVEWATRQTEVCRYVPTGVTAAEDATPVSSDAPVLFLVGGADPQDPIDNVSAAPAHLPNSVFVVVPGHGHTVAHIGCVGTVVSAFVLAAEVAAADGSCIAHGGAPLTPFRLP